MTIQDAIKKAGPGGKIRRHCGIWEWTLPVEKVCSLRIHNKHGEFCRYATIDDVTATDWEVIESEKIEVGDVVKHRQDDSGAGVVIAVDSGRIFTQWRDGSVTIYSKSGEAYPTYKGRPCLVRKGPRKAEPKVGTERGWHDG